MLRSFVRFLAAHPRMTVLLGAFSISFSGVLYRLSETTPETAAFFRCLYCLPILVVAAYIERRTASFGGRGAGARYWLTCVAAPGVRLCWQTSAAQASQPAPAAIAKSRADMADQVAAREAAFAARVSA